MNHAVFADQIDLFICECVGRIMGRPCDYVVNGKSKKKKSYENNSNEIKLLPPNIWITICQLKNLVIVLPKLQAAMPLIELNERYVF